MVNQKKIKISNILSKIVISLLLTVLIIYTVSIFLPILWSVTTSLKTRGDFSENPIGLPSKWMFTNYTFVFSMFKVKIGSGYIPLSYMIVYTLLYAVGCSFFYTLAHCITAYAVARFDFYLSKVIRTIVIICMVLPIVGSLPSELNMARRLGLYDTFWGVWFMKTNFLGVYFLVFFSLFRSLPKDYFQAPEIDGASNLQVLFYIVLPLIRNTFFIVMLIHFINFWNDYQIPMLYLPSFPTLAYGLYLFEFSTENDLSTVPMKLVGCMLIMIPILIIFIIFQRKLIGNITFGGLKE